MESEILDNMLKNDDVEKLILLEQKNWNIFDKSKKLIAKSIKKDAIEIFSYLLNHKDYQGGVLVDLLKESIKNNANKITNYLVESKIQEKENKVLIMSTALIFCVDLGKLKTTKYLLENGANVHYQDEAAIRWSIDNGNVKMVKFLLENGAILNKENNNPILWCANTKKVEMLEYIFRERKQDPEILTGKNLSTMVNDWLTLFKVEKLKESLEKKLNKDKDYKSNNKPKI